MLGKLIGISLTKTEYNIGAYRETIHPYDQSQTYGKTAIEVTGSLIANEIANTITASITNYYPDRIMLSKDKYYYCDITMGYADNKASMGHITGEVMNVYTEYTGVDSKTVITINTGVYKNAYTKNVSIEIPRNGNYYSAIRQIASATGMSARVDTLTLDRASKPFLYEGNAMDGISKLKKAMELDGLSINVSNGVIALVEEGKGKITHVIKSVTSPIRINDGGISVTMPFDPKISVGDTIEVNPMFYVNSGGIFTSNLQTSFWVYQIDFGFSTVGNMNYMNIHGTSVKGLF